MLQTSVESCIGFSCFHSKFFSLSVFYLLSFIIFEIFKYKVNYCELLVCFQIAEESVVVADIVIPSTRVSDMASRIGATGYVECSSKTGDGIEELVKELVVAAHFRPKENKSSECCFIV